MCSASLSPKQCPAAGCNRASASTTKWVKISKQKLIFVFLADCTISPITHTFIITKAQWNNYEYLPNRPCKAICCWWKECGRDILKTGTNNQSVKSAPYSRAVLENRISNESGLWLYLGSRFPWVRTVSIGENGNSKNFIRCHRIFQK